jgi:hypothetical protein
MGARVPLVLVVLIVLLFAVGAGLGARNASSSSPSCSREDEAAWRDRIFRPRPVASAEISGCTTALGRPFRVPGSCDVVVAPATDGSRRLVIKGTGGRLATTMEANSASMTMRATLDADAGSEVTIGKEGGKVTLTCDPGPQCLATLQ